MLNLIYQKARRELMSQDEIAVMDCSHGWQQVYHAA